MDPSTLAREFGPMISSLAYQFFGSSETARDAAQEAWVEIVKDLPTFRGESSVKTWVYAVAWRRMLRFKRREKETSLRTLRDHYRTLNHPAPTTEVPEARYLAEEACRSCMTGVLFCLTADQRLAFLFRYTAELDYQTIADILETSPANARKLYSRARETLARFMSGDCRYPRPTGRCAYGMEPWIRAGGLDQAFARLGSFGSRVAAYRIHPRLMPGPNYWHAAIAAPDSLSQHEAALP